MPPYHFFDFANRAPPSGCSWPALLARCSRCPFQLRSSRPSVCSEFGSWIGFSRSSDDSIDAKHLIASSMCNATQRQRARLRFHDLRRLNRVTGWCGAERRSRRLMAAETRGERSVPRNLRTADLSHACTGPRISVDARVIRLLRPTKIGLCQTACLRCLVGIEPGICSILIGCHRQCHSRNERGSVRGMSPIEETHRVGLRKMLRIRLVPSITASKSFRSSGSRRMRFRFSLDHSRVANSTT